MSLARPPMVSLVCQISFKVAILVLSILRLTNKLCTVCFLIRLLSLTKKLYFEIDLGVYYLLDYNY